MKRIIVSRTTVILLLIGPFSFANEKERHEGDRVIHTSMKELNAHMNMIFKSILRSDSTSLAESGHVFNRVAENLKGTKPPKSQGTWVLGGGNGNKPGIDRKEFRDDPRDCVRCHTLSDTDFVMSSED